MVFNQKPRKPIMFTANTHKNTPRYCQPNKDSICYNLSLHTHDEDHLQYLPLYLDCQNNHYEVDLLGTSTFKPIPYSHWIKNNTQQKTIKQQPHKKDPFPLIEKENLTDIINLSGPPINDLNYTMNQVFDLHDPLDTIPLSKFEVADIFLSPTETITLQLLQN